MCFGSGALAEYAVTGSSPSATATGMRPSSEASRSARPSLCICQCMNVELRSITCIRYMPTLRTPVFGSFVMTAGSVMNGAGSPGQQRWTGNRPRSTSAPSRKTSWHGAFETVFGSESATDFSFSSPLTFSLSPCGGCMSRMSPSFAAASSRLATPNARHMRRSVPNWLMSSGWCEPFGFSKSSAGPPDFTTRSVISVISRSGSTSGEMRRSSPSRSRSAIQSRRSRGGGKASSVYGRECVRHRLVERQRFALGRHSSRQSETPPPSRSSAKARRQEANRASLGTFPLGSARASASLLSCTSVTLALRTHGRAGGRLRETSAARAVGVLASRPPR